MERIKRIMRLAGGLCVLLAGLTACSRETDVNALLRLTVTPMSFGEAPTVTPEAVPGKVPFTTIEYVDLKEIADLTWSMDAIDYAKQEDMCLSVLAQKSSVDEQNTLWLAGSMSMSRDWDENGQETVRYWNSASQCIYSSETEQYLGFSNEGILMFEIDDFLKEHQAYLYGYLQDEAGRTVCITKRSLDGSKQEFWYYEYGPEGYVIREYHFPEEEKVKVIHYQYHFETDGSYYFQTAPKGGSYSELHFYPSGVLAKEIVYLLDGTVVREQGYDEQGRCLLELWYEDGVRIARQYQYDETGNGIIYNEYHNDQLVSEVQYEYRYNNLGMLEVYEEYVDETLAHHHYYRYTYLTDNRLWLVEMVDEDGSERKLTEWSYRAQP